MANRKREPAITVGFGLYATVPMLVLGFIISIFGASQEGGFLVYVGTAMLAAACLLFGISMYALGFQAHERAAAQPMLDEAVRYTDEKVEYAVRKSEQKILRSVKRLLDEE